MSNPTSPPKEKVIIDSNIWLFACAMAGSEGPDNNSKHDRSVRADNQIDPRKLRGTLIQLFKTKYVIVPEKVIEELNGLSQNPKLSTKNQKNLEGILNEMLGRETQTEINRDALEEQNRIFKEIEARSEASSNNPIPINKACAKTWNKIKLDEDNADIALTSCPTRGLHPHTLLLHEIEELRRRKKELTSTPKDAQSYYKSIVALESKIRRSKPFILPDIEILLCAEKTGATVISKDQDMLVLWACSERFQKSTKKPVIPAGFQGPEQDFKSFTKEANKSIRKHPPEQQEGGPTPGMGD